MHNIGYEIKGSKLLITIDVGAAAVQSAKPSSTGKTYLLASTHGAVPLPTIQGRSATVSLNLMLKSMP